MKRDDKMDICRTPSMIPLTLQYASINGTWGKDMMKIVLQSPVLGPEKDQGLNWTTTDRNQTLVSVAMGCSWSQSQLSLIGLGERL